MMPAPSIIGLPEDQPEVKAAYFLTDLKKAPLAVEHAGEITMIKVPAKAYDPVDTVIVLEIEGLPDVEALPIKPESDGSILLKAIDADLHGAQILYEEGPDNDDLGRWTEAGDWAEWYFEAAAAGTYAVEITYSCDKGLAGSAFELALADQKLAGKTRDTGAWKNFRTAGLGTLKVKTAGRYTLSVKPVKLA